MTTDQTTLREDLIAKIVVESLTQVPCDGDSHLPSWAYFAARTILAEFPDLGQQPHTHNFNYVTSSRFECDCGATATITTSSGTGQQPQITLHVPTSDLPPRFTPSDTHIKAGLAPAALDDDADVMTADEATAIINSCGYINLPVTIVPNPTGYARMKLPPNPAAQPQIDRSKIENILDRYVFVSVEAGELESEKPGRYVAERDAIRKQIIAHLNAAPAAQPLPTMTVSEFKSTASHHTLDILRKRVPVIVVPDEPEPQVDANLMTEEECVDWLNENVGVGMDKWFVSQPVISVRLARGTEPMMCAPDRLTAMRALVAKAVAKRTRVDG